MPNGPTVGITGIYLDVCAPIRLEHTWLVEGDEAETVVRFELHPDRGGTRLELTHKGFADSKDRGRNEGGWDHQLDRLTTALARTNK